MASHQIIVKSVVVVVSSGASVSKYVRGRVKSSFLMNLLNLISFGIFVRFSHKLIFSHVINSTFTIGTVMFT